MAKSKTKKVATRPDLGAEFVDQVKVYMRQHDITVTQAAAMTGASRTYIYEVFAQSKSPTLEWCERFAKAIGMDVRITIRNVVAEAAA